MTSHENKETISGSQFVYSIYVIHVNVGTVPSCPSLHITREFYSIKLICTNLHALFSYVKKAYTANQNCVQLFHMWKYMYVEVYMSSRLHLLSCQLRLLSRKRRHYISHWLHVI